jgi:hypothetical protein
VADINFGIAPLSGEAIEIRGLHDGSMVNVSTVNNTYSTVNNNSASWALTVKEADGSPTVDEVKTIVVTNGTLTDNSNGQVTIDTGGSGGGVWETDTIADVVHLASASEHHSVVVGYTPATSAARHGRFVVRSADAGGAVAVLSGAGSGSNAALVMSTMEGTFAMHVAPTGANENILYFNCGPTGPYAGAQIDYPGQTTTPNAVVMSLSAIPNVTNSGLLDINHIYARTKIGVGTSNPGEALSVVGNISASGDIIAANNSYKFANGEKLAAGDVTNLKAASGGSVTVANLGTDNTPTINFNAGQMQHVAINGNCTFQNATNVAVGGNVVLQITGDGTARTLAFPSVWKFIGAKPTTIKAGGLSLLQLLVFNGTGQDNIVCTYNTQD